MNGTSGVSGLTGGNCTRAEYDQYQRDFATVHGWDGTFPDTTQEPAMSERFMTQAQYNDSESVTYPVRDTWVRPLTPYDNIAAELRAIGKRLDYVLAHAGGKLDAPELHEFCGASRALDELVTALTT